MHVLWNVFVVLCLKHVGVTISHARVVSSLSQGAFRPAGRFRFRRDVPAVLVEMVPVFVVYTVGETKGMLGTISTIHLIGG